MKINHYLVVVIFFHLASCTPQKSEETTFDEDSLTSEQTTEAPASERSLQTNKQQKPSKVLVMTPLKNGQTGEITGHIPIPKNWKLVNNSFRGPSGIETRDYPNRFYTFQQRMVIPLEQVVREDLAPIAKSSGIKILGTFEIPEIANYDRGYSQLLWKFGNPQQEFHALGVDTEEPNGKRTLLILRQMITRSQFGGSWGYYINAISAETDAYEEAKSDYIFALSHVQPNMEQIQRYNQNEIAKSNASWAAHSARMRANQQAFNARNQAWMDASNAISDMSMQGWRDRNKLNDAGQQAQINSIHEEQTIYNEATGEHMQVDAGSNKYFTNGNNEFIRTDDYLYDPNTDSRVNHYEWKAWEGN